MDSSADSARPCALGLLVICLGSVIACGTGKVWARAESAHRDDDSKQGEGAHGMV